MGGWTLDQQSVIEDARIFYQVAKVLTGATVEPITRPILQPFLYVSFNAGANRCRVRFEYFLDETYTQKVDEDAIVVSANGFFAGTIPVHGQWLRMTLEASAYPTTVNLRVTQVTEPRNALGADGHANSIFNQRPRSVPTGTDVVTSGNTWRGRATLMVELPAIAGSVVLIEGVPFTGTNRFLYRLAGNGLRECVDLALPAIPIQLSMTNPDPANQNFYVGLNGHYMSW